MIYADQRWIGDHGIGRFARCVLANLDFRPVRLASHPASPLDAWHLARALSELTADDLFFSPGYNTPLYSAAPFVFTICDLCHIHCADISSPPIRVYYATILKRACHRATNILTISEFTRSQIIEWSGVSPEKVANVQCGVDPAYQPSGGAYGLPFPYLLCVSNRRKHKNERRLLEAFAMAALDPAIHLVFTGPTSPEMRSIIHTLSLAPRVDFVGIVPEAKLPALYRGAEALVFPSLYEGFGLPLVEAMACGTPVVTSSVTAMPEVAGNAALFVDPKSVDEIAGAMERIVQDTSLRSRLRKNGISRAAQFSWSSTVARVMEVLARSVPSGSVIKDRATCMDSGVAS
jgi:glycosyltransferase involved in cell wall biosynthesis